jgi:hypothetical protein
MPTNATDQTTAAHFAELAARWRADTEFFSSPAAMAKHPAYREIIAMGEPAVPLSWRNWRRGPTSGSPRSGRSRARTPCLPRPGATSRQ